MGTYSTQRTIRLWRDDFGTAPPFDIGPDTLFVAYSAWAEMTCFKLLGWQFPVHVFDQHTAYLAASNALLPYDPDELRKKPRKRLPDACRAYGIEGWERIDKDAIARDIGEGRWRDHGCEQVFAYCEEDVRMSMQLLRAQLQGRSGLPPADVERVLHWSNYSAKCIALIQARGMPIDMTLWNLVQENKAAVVGQLLRQFDPSHAGDDPIYSPDGEWSYMRFEQFLTTREVAAWPRLDSGQLDISSDAFRMMYHVPGIEGLHALRDSLGFIVKARLPIGRDGRNRPSLFPFGTATGRNAHAKSPYNAHAGMRSFMVFPGDTIGAYLDWRTQEVGVAAALSGDTALMEAYRSGDVYHALARVCGLTDDPDPKRWKAQNPTMRNQMKALQLGINYGMGVPSLARGLNSAPAYCQRRLHEDEAKYWSPELCFVSVPIKGQTRDTLHLIDEDIAMRYLPSSRVLRFRLALASKPLDTFFLCHIPSRNFDNSWNESNRLACEQAKTRWAQATSRKEEGVDAYKPEYAKDPDAFPQPNWPTQSLDELIRVTFEGRMITSEDHPGLLRLIGAKQSTS